MKGKQAAAIIAALLLCGCMGQEPQPMEEETLKPPENAQTASGVVFFNFANQRRNGICTGFRWR